MKCAFCTTQAWQTSLFVEWIKATTLGGVTAGKLTQTFRSLISLLKAATLGQELVGSHANKGFHCEMWSESW